MPRATKDVTKKENIENTQTSKKTIKPTKATSISEKNKKEVSKKNTTKKDTSKSTKSNTSTKKKITSTSAKTTKTSSTRTKKSTSATTKKESFFAEYYDLPYRYNETVVKVLAQTPQMLFVYWDISDNDREKYIKAFGDDFFYKTYPVLLLYNEDKKYVREIAVNDFANSWYIDIEDSKTKYTIQLGRKFRNKPEIMNFAEFKQNNIILQTDYLPFADSNKMEAPNDHVLFESLPRFFVFRNVKTNEEITKELRSFKDAFGNNYDIKEFYQDSYQDELSEGMFDMSNPSSGVNSSIFK